jgi:adenylylsulfate kinase-like enzyme
MGAIHRVVPADQHGVCYWFHGNSGSGKTRLAIDFAKPGWAVLDADDMRNVWSLGFSKAERYEQNYRIAKLAKLLNIQGINVCVASICPYAKLRQEIKSLIPWINWVYVTGPDTVEPSDKHPFEEGGWS